MDLEDVVRPFGEHRRGVALCGRRSELLTYDELSRLALHTAEAVRRQGARPGDPVAIALTTDLAHLAAVLGIWIAGCTVVSLPPLPREAASAAAYGARFQQLLCNIGCHTAIGTGRLKSLLAPRISVFEPPLDPAATTVGDPAEQIADTALIQFTSGTTGSPKGVAIPKRALSEHLSAIGDTLRLDPAADCGVSWLPWYHDMGLVGFCLTPLAHRCAMSFLSPQTFLRDPLLWLSTCASTGATMTGAPTFALRLVARRLAATDAVHPRLIDRIDSVGASVSGGLGVALSICTFEWRTSVQIHARYDTRRISAATCSAIIDDVVEAAQTLSA